VNSYYAQRIKKTPEVVALLKAATSWKAACDAVRIYAGAGPYVGGQALCTLVFGVLGGDPSEVLPNLDLSTTAAYSTFGPGPKAMILKLWNKECLHDAGVVSRIAWLAEHAEDEFEKRGLSFPFQVAPPSGSSRFG